MRETTCEKPWPRNVRERGCTCRVTDIRKDDAQGKPQRTLVSQKTRLFPGTLYEQKNEGRTTTTTKGMISESDVTRAYEYFDNLSPEGRSSFITRSGSCPVGSQARVAALARRRSSLRVGAVHGGRSSCGVRRQRLGSLHDCPT